MPIYRFEVEACMGTQAAIARIQELVGPPRSFWSGFTFGSDDSMPPFIGKVEGNSFHIRRDIHYRNAFLPLVWGRVRSVPAGARINVTMFLHPFVALFMAAWFYGLGVVAWELLHLTRVDHWAPFGPIGLLVFGVVVVSGGFFPEAAKARRVLEHAFAERSA